jgi:hypothetical protein
MPQWGNTDDANSAPVYLDKDAANPDANTNVYFVDTTEAGVAANRSNGLKTPGWTLYEEYGSGRKRVEVLVPMKRTAGDAGDLGVTGNTATEDTVVVDS